MTQHVADKEVMIQIRSSDGLTLPHTFPNTILLKQERADWTKTAVVLLGTVNLGLVIFIFLMNRRDKLRERAVDQEKDIDTFWIQKLVLEPHVEDIRKFFEKSSRDVRNHVIACRAGELDVISKGNFYAGEFGQGLSSIVQRVVTPLNLISPLFSERMGRVLDDLEDNVTAVFDRHGFATNEPVERVLEVQNRFWQELLACHKDLLKSRENQTQCSSPAGSS